jgi:chromosomal replication initiator protein
MTQLNRTERKLLKEMVALSMSNHFKDGYINKTITSHTKRINLETIRISQEERAKRLLYSQTSTIEKLEKLLEIVALRFNTTTDLIKGHRRFRELVAARQVFCYVARYEIQCSLLEIGAFLSGRDHSTILYSVNNAVPSLIFNDKGIETKIKYITKLYNAQSR